MAVQTVKLNLIPGSVFPVVNVSQYDDKRQFYLDVYEGAETYSLTGKTVEIRGTKPDMHGFAYGIADGVISVSGNRVTVYTTQQMTACGGQVMAELRISSGSTMLGTLNFIIACEPTALADDTITSDTEIPIIERYLENIIGQIDGYVDDAEAWAKGTREGAPVPSTDPAYHNNAEYYAQQAADIAVYPPYIGNNNHWWIYSTDQGGYIDSGVDAYASISVGTTTTLPAGSSATVTGTGTGDDLVLHFGIPRGADGSGSMRCETETETIIFTPGGGGGGTGNYPDLTNKPSINSVTLVGNKTSAELDLTSLVGSYNNEALTLT